VSILAPIDEYQPNNAHRSMDIENLNNPSDDVVFWDKE
jgi:hypothetical protein